MGCLSLQGGFHWHQQLGCPLLQGGVPLAAGRALLTAEGELCPSRQVPPTAGRWLLAASEVSLTAWGVPLATGGSLTAGNVSPPAGVLVLAAGEPPPARGAAKPAAQEEAVPLG